MVHYILIIGSYPIYDSNKFITGVLLADLNDIITRKLQDKLITLEDSKKYNYSNSWNSCAENLKLPKDYLISYMLSLNLKCPAGTTSLPGSTCVGQCFKASLILKSSLNINPFNPQNLINSTSRVKFNYII